MLELLQQPSEVEKVLIRKGGEGASIQELKESCRRGKVPYQMVPVQVINKLVQNLHPTQRVNHQGVLAFRSAISYFDMDDIYNQVITRGETPLFVLLDGVTDVRNIGAIARSALGLGAHALCVPLYGSARLQGDAIKTSAGALHHISVCRYTSVKQAISFFSLRGLQIWVADARGENIAGHVDFSLPGCLVFGDEGAGVSAAFVDAASVLFRLPQNELLESYNVSVSCALALYEVNRQRNTQ